MDPGPPAQQLDEFLARFNYFNSGSPLPLTPSQERNQDICLQILSSWHSVADAEEKLKQVSEKGKRIGRALFKQAMQKGSTGTKVVGDLVEYFGSMEKKTKSEATELRAGIKILQRVGGEPEGLNLMLEVDWAALQKLDHAFFKNAKETLRALLMEQPVAHGSNGF